MKLPYHLLLSICVSLTRGCCLQGSALGINYYFLMRRDEQAIVPVVTPPIIPTKGLRQQQLTYLIQGCFSHYASSANRRLPKLPLQLIQQYLVCFSSQLPPDDLMKLVAGYCQDEDRKKVITLYPSYPSPEVLLKIIHSYTFSPYDYLIAKKAQKHACVLEGRRRSDVGVQRLSGVCLISFSVCVFPLPFIFGHGLANLAELFLSECMGAVILFFGIYRCWKSYS